MGSEKSPAGKKNAKSIYPANTYHKENRKIVHMSAALRNILLWILMGTKGGIRRATIINALNERPMTASQLQRMIGLDYKTVRYHLDLLLENNLIETTGKRYGMLYVIAPMLEADYEVFLKIWDKIENGKDY